MKIFTKLIQLSAFLGLAIFFGIKAYGGGTQYFIFTPVIAPPAEIIEGHPGVIQYSVKTAGTKAIIIGPVTGISGSGLTQDMTPQDSCKDGSQISDQQSCTLRFNFSTAVNNANISISVKGQPSFHDELNINIKSVPDTDPTLATAKVEFDESSKKSFLPGDPATLKITNNSPSPINTIQLDLSHIKGLTTDQKSPVCGDILRPNESCKVNLKLASDAIPGTAGPIVIKGANMKDNAELQFQVQAYVPLTLSEDVEGAPPLDNKTLELSETFTFRVKNSSAYTLKNIQLESNEYIEVSAPSSNDACDLDPGKYCKLTLKAKKPTPSGSAIPVSVKTDTTDKATASFKLTIKDYQPLKLLDENDQPLTSVSLYPAQSSSFKVQNVNAYFSVNAVSLQESSELQGKVSLGECAGELKPESVCKVSLVANPTATATQGTITVSTPAFPATSSFKVQVSPYSQLALLDDSGKPLSLLSLQPGQKGGFTIKNGGSLVATGIKVTPPQTLEADASACKDLQPNEACSVNLTAKPDADVTSDQEPLKVEVSATAGASSAILSVQILSIPLSSSVSNITLIPGASETYSFKNNGLGIAKTLHLNLTADSLKDVTVSPVQGAFCQATLDATGYTLGNLEAGKECQLTFQAKQGISKLDPQNLSIKGANTTQLDIKLSIDNAPVTVNWADESLQHLQYKLIAIRNNGSTPVELTSDVKLLFNQGVDAQMSLCDRKNKACYSQTLTLCQEGLSLNNNETCYVGFGLKSSQTPLSLGSKAANLTLSFDYDENGKKSSFSKSFPIVYDTSLYIGTGKGTVNNDFVSRWTGDKFISLKKEQGAYSPAGDIYTTAVVDGDLYVGGKNGVSKWNGEIWIQTGQLNGTVTALSQGGGYISSSARVIASVTDSNQSSQLYHYNGTQWTSYSKPLNGPIQSLLPFPDNSNIYIGGGFHTDNNAIIKISAGAFSPIGDKGLDGIVESMTYQKGKLYLAGLFQDTIPSSSANLGNIAQWDGQKFSSVGAATLDGEVFTLYSDQTNLYVGGNFHNAVDSKGNKTPLACLAISDGTHFQALGTAQNLGQQCEVKAIALIDNILYVGGAFTKDTAVGHNHIVGIDLQNKEFNDLGSGLPGVVRTIIAVPAILISN